MGLEERSKKKKVVVFVDGPNCNKVQDLIQGSMDFKRLMEFLVGDRELQEPAGARYFMIGPVKGEAQQGFVDTLRGLGYSVRISERGADVDSLIIEDLEPGRICPDPDVPDVVILVSGDRDFQKPLQTLKELGVEIEIASAEGMVSGELLKSSDRFIDLKRHREQVIDPYRTALRYPPIPELIEFVSYIASLPLNRRLLIQQIIQTLINSAPVSEVKIRANGNDPNLQIMEIPFSKK